MKIWGRTGQVNNVGGTWVAVETDNNGYNDQLYLTALCQVLKLNLYESPLYSNYGIPVQQTEVTQVYPDYYAMQTQSQFAPYFALLTITRVPYSSPPVYNVNAICHSGSILNTTVAT